MVSLEIIAELKGHTERVWDAVWHPFGSFIASCGGGAVIKLWRPQGDGDNIQWVCYSELTGAHRRTIRALSFSPCGLYLACASFDATASVYVQRKTTHEDNKYPTYKLIATLEGHENEVKGVAWNSNGNMLATCGRDKSVWVWEMEDDHEFECLAVLQEHTQDVKSISWHPSEDIIISTSYDDTCKVWRAEDDDFSCVETLTGHTSTVWSSSFHPSGNYLVTAGDDCCLKIWENYSNIVPNGDEAVDHQPHAGWQCKETLNKAHERTIYSVDWCKKDGKYIASVGGDNSLNIYRADDPPSIIMICTRTNAHSADVNSVYWHPRDPTLLITGGDDAIVRMWRFIDG